VEHRLPPEPGSRADATTAGVRRLRPGILFSLTSMITIQTGNALAAPLISRISALGATAVRTIFAAALLTAVLRPRVLGRSQGDRWVVAAFGVVLLAQNISFYEALSRLSLGIAVTISLLGPLGAAVLHSTRRRDGLWVVLSLAGVLLIADTSTAGGLHVSEAGLGWGLLSALSWGTYVLIAARAVRQFGGLDGLALGFALAGLVSIPIALGSAGAGLWHLGILSRGLLVGALAGAIPFTLESQALRRLGERIFGILASVEPAIALIIGVILLGQTPTVPQVLGMALVALAAAGASMTPERRFVALEGGAA
jgi:inner membrane transporter RhtA